MSDNAYRADLGKLLAYVNRQLGRNPGVMNFLVNAPENMQIDEAMDFGNLGKSLRHPYTGALQVTEGDILKGGLDPRVVGALEFTKPIVLNGREVDPGDIGNLGVGVSAARAGIPRWLLKPAALAYTALNNAFEVPLKRIQANYNLRAFREEGKEGPPSPALPYTGSVVKEIERDWPLYDMGYKIAKQGRDVTKSDLADMQSRVNYADTSYGVDLPQVRDTFGRLTPERRRETVKRLIGAGVTK